MGFEPHAASLETVSGKFWKQYNRDREIINQDKCL